MPKIFISYRRADASDAAGRIYDRLVAAFGSHSIFKDVDSIPPGADFGEVIAERLKGCQAVIVVIGRFWLLPPKQGAAPRLHDPNDFVRLEVEHALKHRLLIIPALVGKAGMPATDKLPKSLHPLATRNAVAIRPDPDFHRDMDRLIEAIQSRFPSQQPPPIPVLAPAQAISATPPVTYQQAPPHYAEPHYYPPPRQTGAPSRFAIGCIAWIVALVLLAMFLLAALGSWLLAR